MKEEKYEAQVFVVQEDILHVNFTCFLSHYFLLNEFETKAFVLCF